MANVVVAVVRAEDGEGSSLEGDRGFGFGL